MTLTAAATKTWFANPAYGDDTDDRLVRQEPERPEESVTYGAPLTVTDEGQIHGHAALWGRCHVGFNNSCVQPPKEPSSYRGYLVGAAVDGVPTGPLVLGTGHADMNLTAAAARRWYDDTGAAVADVTVGTDKYGIWVAGGLRDSVAPGDIQALRGSALSGDWRIIAGSLKLVALLAVSSPGFRVHRAYALAASGAIVTTGPTCIPCAEEGNMETWEDRVERLERVVWDRIFDGIE